MEISRRAARRHVEIFNFSFLDILACVIGLLIFILTIVVISGGIGAATSSKDQSAAVTGSEQRVQQARLRADLAARRRHNAESLLRSTASDVGDITLAKDAVETQIHQFIAEQTDLAATNAATAARIAALRRQLGNINSDPAAVARLADIFTEIASLDRDTSQLQQKIHDLEALAPSAKKEVSFYVPRVRSTSKRAIFIEVQGRRMWFVESDDYDDTPAIRGHIYWRRARAAGISTASVAANEVPAPDAIAGRAHANIVLTFLVRPDGFEGFREIREWAWKKGYSVHWFPLPSDETIQLVPAEHSWEQ